MLCKLNKYGELNNYDVLKIFAFMLMVIDHIGFFFLPEVAVLRAIGRVSFPIYAILHGVITKNNAEHKTNYLLLFLGLLVNLIFFLLFRQWIALDILVMFFLFDFIFIKVPKVDYKVISMLFILTAINYYFYATLNNYMEYGLFVLLFMMVGKIFYKVGMNMIENMFSLCVFVTYFLTQVSAFDFDITCSIISGIGLTILFFSVYNFKFREYHNIKSNKFLLFISRYSLELYFGHYVLFMFAYRLLF